MSSFRLALASAALLLGCGDATPRTQPPAVDVGATSAVGSTAAPGATVKRASAGAPMIACGKGRCDATAEVCCGDPKGDDATCAKRVAPQTAPSMEDLQKQSEACQSRPPAFCDDSGDCPSGTSCCDQFVSSDSDVVVCAQHCDYAELCSTDAPCRTPGTACVEGKCVFQDVHVVCGSPSKTCSGATPVCCVDPDASKYACAKSCASGHTLRCTGPRDCAAGAFCQMNVMGDSYCTGLLDVANAGVMCKADADCPADICLGKEGKKPRCAPGPAERTCECPD